MVYSLDIVKLCISETVIMKKNGTFKLGRVHEKQWIRRSESTSAKRELIWIYEYTAFECVLRLNTPQTNRHFFMIGCLVVDIF